MIKNDAGKVAMVYFQTIPQRVKIEKVVYDFAVKRNICFAWVDEAHVPAILGIVKTCCGGNKTHPYRLANEMHVRVWSGLAER